MLVEWAANVLPHSPPPKLVCVLLAGLDFPNLLDRKALKWSATPLIRM
jgi:hypothetical protein